MKPFSTVFGTSLEAGSRQAGSAGRLLGYLLDQLLLLRKILVDLFLLLGHLEPE